MSTNGLYVKLPKYCKYMTRKELLEFFPEGTETKIITSGKKKGQTYEAPLYTSSFMMRTLIMNELEYCDRHETRTLRGVWYSAIKPTLDKLGLLDESDNDEDTLKRWDATLSNYVCDLLRKGLLTFEDLGIRDISRQKSNPRESHYSVDSKVYGYKGNITPYPNILIATEKDTVYSVISKIAQLYGCSSISCKGQNSLGAMESIVKGMYDVAGYIDTIYIITMTDYDPAGYYIAEALEKQVRDIANSIGRYPEIETHRIGITPEQLSKEEVLRNMYSPKKANIDKWMSRTGGIDGMEKGLELDALSTREIREIFVDNIKSFIDEELYKDFIKKSYVKLKVLESIKNKVEEVSKKVIEQLVDDIELKDFDIHEFAKNGQSSLYIEDLCENDIDDKIKSTSLFYLKQ